MKIEYKTTKDFEPDDLKDLFLSVDWSSGHYPEKLVVAMQNSATVFSAWDGEKLVGLINTLDDKVMTAYVHYLLVVPEYQKKGIGGTLVKMITDKYADYMRIVLIAYEKETQFYEYMGFRTGDGKVPMFVTSLWT